MIKLWHGLNHFLDKELPGGADVEGGGVTAKPDLLSRMVWRILNDIPDRPHADTKIYLSAENQVLLKACIERLEAQQGIASGRVDEEPEA